MNVAVRVSNQPMWSSDNCMFWVKSKPYSLLFGTWPCLWLWEEMSDELLVCHLRNWWGLEKKLNPKNARTPDTLCNKRQNTDTERWRKLSCMRKGKMLILWERKMYWAGVERRHSGGSLYFGGVLLVPFTTLLFCDISVLFILEVYEKLLLFYLFAAPRGVDKIELWMNSETADCC